jgi:hypothetical protein
MRYMADMSGVLREIARMIDSGRLIVASGQPGQQGTTTAVIQLGKACSPTYALICVHLAELGSYGQNEEWKFLKAMSLRLLDGFARVEAVVPFKAKRAFKWIINPKNKDAAIMDDLVDAIRLLRHKHHNGLVLSIDEIGDACCDDHFIRFLRYMADVSTILQEIRKMIDDGYYFVINRPRQYGKTTAIIQLKNVISPPYLYISISLEGFSNEVLNDEKNFCRELSARLIKSFSLSNETIPSKARQALNKMANPKTKGYISVLTLVDALQYMCIEYEQGKIVLSIDEVDAACDSDIFINFLGALRNDFLYYRDKTFQSVILAGVRDVRNLKSKIRPDSESKGESNSPWNIAEPFDLDMSLSVSQIESMLSDYEADHGIGFDVAGFSRLLRERTSGYPFLVSSICKLIDRKLAGSDKFPDKKAAWSYEGFLEAKRMLLADKKGLFESLKKQLEDDPELRLLIKAILFSGKEISEAEAAKPAEAAILHGFIKVGGNGLIQVSNMIFEEFLTEILMYDGLSFDDFAKAEKGSFIRGGRLDMLQVLERFSSHFDETFPL